MRFLAAFITITRGFEFSVHTGVGELTIVADTALHSRFDIFQFPFRFNPGTNGGNVEMGLINKSYLLTLNQRVPGSSPGAPTTPFKGFS
jgi:hypothetical protein